MIQIHSSQRKRIILVNKVAVLQRGCIFLLCIPAWSSSSFLQSAPLAVTQSSLRWWKWLWIKRKLYLTRAAQGPDGRLACSQGERWALYLSSPYPIRVSPSITPYIQRMRAAFAKLCAPRRPLFTLLTASLSSRYLSSWSNLQSRQRVSLYLLSLSSWI